MSVGRFPIYFTSTHPTEHKLAAYRYYIERMLNLPLRAEHQKREWSTILHIAQQNGFPPTVIPKLRHQIKHLTQHINSLHIELQFNPSQESNGCVNFLDLTINRRTFHLELDIYRKPTATHTTIHFTSTHPNEHKLATYRDYIERMLNLHHSRQNTRKENGQQFFT